MTEVTSSVYVSQCETELRTLVLRLKSLYSTYEQFGSSLDRVDPKRAACIVILYRLTKYWAEQGNVAQLHEGCATKTLELDFRLEHFKPSWWGDDFLRSSLLKAKAIIRKGLKGLHFDPRTCSNVFSSGSSAISARGHNSILERALDVTQWACTQISFIDVCLLFHSTRFLKLAAHHHFRSMRMNRFKNRDIPTEWKDNVYSLIAHIGDPDNEPLPQCYPVEFNSPIAREVHIGECFFMFRMWFVVDFQEYAKFLSIEKSAEENRGIEPQLWMLVCLQLALSHTVLRKACKRLGCDLDDQTVQQRRIGLEGSGGRLTTGDLTSASECNSLWAVQNLFDPHISKLLMAYRCDFLYFNNTDQMHLLNKVSSMGNGFTFEVMSLILTGVCQAFDETATVYGDDIIASSDSWPYIETVLEELGYIINTKKTFYSSSFRESCGAFYKDGFGYILSYKLERPLNVLDADIAINKLYILSNYAKENMLEGEWIKAIDDSLKRLHALVPLRRKRECFLVKNTRCTPRINMRSMLLDVNWELPYTYWAELPLDRGVYYPGCVQLKQKRSWPSRANLYRHYIASSFHLPIREIEMVKTLRFKSTKSRAWGFWKHNAGSSDHVPVLTGSYYCFGSSSVQTQNWKKRLADTSYHPKVTTMGVKTCEVSNRGEFGEHTCLLVRGDPIPLHTIRAGFNCWERELLLKFLQLTLLLAACDLFRLHPLNEVRKRRARSRGRSTI